MARYIPTDETATFLAREYIRRQLESELKRGRITVSLGEMAEDGTCPVYLRAEAEEFDLANFFDIPQIDGTAWMDDGSRHDVRYEFPGDLQPYTFLRENGAAA